MHNIYIDHMLPSFSHRFFEKYVFIELCSCAVYETVMYR